MNKWQQKEHDRKLLLVLYRFGALTPGAAARLTGMGPYAYKRLWYLSRKIGLVNEVVYFERLGPRKRKAAVLYYLTTQGVRYVFKELGQDVPVNLPRQRPVNVELEVRKSKFVEAVAPQAGSLLPASEVRKGASLPHNVALHFLVGQVGVYILPSFKGEIRPRTVRWLVECVSRLQHRGIVRDFVVFAPDLRQQLKVIKLLMAGRRAGNLHILRSGQESLLFSLAECPAPELLVRLRTIFGEIDVERNLFFTNLPPFTVTTRSKKFYMADVSTFGIVQLTYCTKFSVELARKNGLSPYLVAAVDSVDSLRLIRQLYGELAKEMRLVVLGEPFERSLYAFDDRGEPVCDMFAVRAVTR